MAVRYVAVVGSRSWRRERRVAEVVHWLLRRGFGIVTGGAEGADTHALAVVLRAGVVDRGRVILPWPLECFPRRSEATITVRTFVARGGQVESVLSTRPGRNMAAPALRTRTELVVDASCGVVAFLAGATLGTWLAIHYAVRVGKPVVVVTTSGKAPHRLPGGRWMAVDSGPLAGAFRWVPDPPDPESALRLLQDIVTVTSLTSMPVEDTMAHVSCLSQGDRLWFERCEVVGDKIVAPHLNESDGRPSFLSVPALRKRFGCDAATAVELGELFFALDADETVVGSYVGEAARWGLDAIRKELFRLVVGLAEVEESDDPVEDAEPYRDDPDDADDELPAMPSIAYHVVGSLFGDDEEGPDWVARQPQWLRDLLSRIETCPSLSELATLGQTIYAMPLIHEQAGVAWTWYRLRKARLVLTTRLSPPAQKLMQQLRRVPEHALPRFGAHLYRLQHNGFASLPSYEWAVLWQAYRDRKAALAL